MPGFLNLLPFLKSRFEVNKAKDDKEQELMFLFKFLLPFTAAKGQNFFFFFISYEKAKTSNQKLQFYTSNKITLNHVETVNYNWKCNE